MYIEGTYTLPALPADVWHYLMDREVLLHTIPGVERVEQLDKHAYAVKIQVKYAPLKGTYQGKINISEQEYLKQYQINFEGEGRQGPISSAGKIHLYERDHTTTIIYQGTITTGKQFLPSILAKGAAKLLMQQFFTALDAQIYHKTQKKDQEILSQQTMGSTLVLPQPLSYQQQTGIFEHFRHVMKTSADNSIRTLQRSKNSQRIGLSLLLLITVGILLIRRRNRLS